MFQVFEYIKIALRNIASSKGRSFLTMLGIIIGISSVIMIITIGNGVSGTVSGELDTLGGGMIEIIVNSSEADADVAFTQDDIDFLMNKVEHIKGATPVATWVGTADSPKGDFDAIIMAGNTALEYYAQDPMIRGRYFSESDSASAAAVCVLSSASAISMFGTDDVVGMSFDVDLYGESVTLRITGIRQDSQSRLMNAAMGATNAVMLEMPYTVLASVFGMDMDDFQSLVIFPDTTINGREVARQSFNLLNARKGTRGTNVLQMQSMADVTDQFNSVMGYLTLFVSLVAAISLLVGGIGVMNIMLVSVTERTREIGIRKALGARTGSILLQFLAEAGIITLLGGIIGIILGIVAALIICNAVNIVATVDPMVVLLAALFSSAVGIFFGIYPARKAAHLSPIDALRYE